MHPIAERVNTLLGGACGYAIGFGGWLLGMMRASPSRRPVFYADLFYFPISGAIGGGLISYGIHLMSSSQTKLNLILGVSGSLLVYYVCGTLYAGLASLTRDWNRLWFAKVSGRFVVIAVIWAVLAGISLYGPDLLRMEWWALGPDPIRSRWWAVALVAIVSGIATLLIGRSGVTAATETAESVKVAEQAAKVIDKASETGITGIVMALARMVNLQITPARIATVSAIVFATIVTALLALCVENALASLEHLLHVPQLLTATILEFSLVALAFLLSGLLDLNKFSLQASIRDRLIQAFVGPGRSSERRPDAFTGRDPHDNVSLSHIVPKKNGGKLFHVMNAALHLSASSVRASVEHRVEPFTFSRLHCGNPFVGFFPSARYARNVTVGTAMAISGAAATPEQGYSASPLVEFVLTLFGARLGWWLGNPKRRSALMAHPTSAIVPAIRKLFGANSAEAPWIYLADGGHFDNLGLYEMIRRRCRFIVVIDASPDPRCTFRDLGDAVRNVYTDFGVEVTFRAMDIRARESEGATRPGAYFAIGTIQYSGNARPGWLLYIKPAYYGGQEGVKIGSYAAGHPDFPHENVLHNRLSNAQVEIYRSLGEYIIQQVCAGDQMPDRQMQLADLRSSAQKQLLSSRSTRA
jgi:hypothetical protein